MVLKNTGKENILYYYLIIILFILDFKNVNLIT